MNWQNKFSGEWFGPWFGPQDDSGVVEIGSTGSLSLAPLTVAATAAASAVETPIANGGSPGWRPDTFKQPQVVIGCTGQLGLAPIEADMSAGVEITGTAAVAVLAPQGDVAASVGISAASAVQFPAFSILGGAASVLPVDLTDDEVFALFKLAA
jgi:hypothetical protein